MFTFKNALESTKDLNNAGISSSISFLPRVRNTPAEIEAEVAEYIKDLALIKTNNLNGDLTVKLQQFGILKDPALTLKALAKIVERARLLDNFIWIDMERASTVSNTLDIFEKLHKEFGNVGICLQAYRRRTDADLNRMLKHQAPIRLVKGFFNDGDITNWHEVTKHYESLAHKLIQGCPRPCIATHDLELIDKLTEEIKNNTKAEIQFFKGVRDEMAIDLSRQGFNIRIYIPYGNVFLYLIHGVNTFDNWRHIQRIIFKCNQIT